MTTMVCFTSAGAAYCIPVQATRSVRLSSEIIPLPAPAPGIAGILPGDPPLTVTCSLGTSGTHVLIVEAHDRIFGLLVDEVTGLRRIAGDDISPPPVGQQQPLVVGTIGSWGRVVLVADPDALAGSL